MNDLQIFNYQDTPVRTVLVDDEPWFIASDLVGILEIGRVHDAVRGLDDDEKGTDTIRTLGGDQEVTIVSEAGMYSLVLRSRKPEAKTFRRWITHEVLPSIRKTGSFGETTPTGRELLAHAVLEAQKMLETKDEQIAVLEPKADAYDAFIDADGTYSVGNVAKMLGLSQNKLFDLMRNAGVMIAKGAMRNTPYQKYMHHFAVKAFEFERSDGTRGTSYTTRIQPSGVDFIRKKIGLEQPLLAV